MVTRVSAAGKSSKSARPEPSKAKRVAAKTVASTLRGGQRAARALGDASQSAMHAAADVSGLIAEASENTLSFNPLVGLGPRDLGAAAQSLLKAVSASPQKATKHYGLYLKELLKVVKGDSELKAEPKDRRFADPAWQGNALYRKLMQSYLLTQKELTSYIDAADLSTQDKGRAQFFASLVTDALAPSNWVLGNPAAVRKIVDTGGDSLVKGLQQLVHDIRHNNGMPSQVDSTPFRVGETVATTPGQVVMRHEVFELLQFTPTTADVHQRPLVIAPPQVNKYYAIDLAPEKSLLKWATDSGVQVFVISWRNPTIEQRHWGIAEYVSAIDAAVDAARQITGSADVNMWGSCSGGMTLAAYLGWLAGTGKQAKIANTTWAVCVLDASSSLEDSMLGLFKSDLTLKAAKARSRRKGIVTGEEMAAMFAWLRPNDLIWNYWVNNYLLGNKPPAFDLLAWNADTTRLPGQFHCDLLELVEKNPYRNPGVLEIHGVPIDMTQVKIGAYVIGGITDHITPWKACYGTARLFGPDSTFVLANAGHLQSLINPPGAPKAYFFSGPAKQDNPMTWVAAAQPARVEGSWWPHWRQWITARSGELVPAPKKLGSRKHKPLGAAPGTYVHEK